MPRAWPLSSTTHAGQRARTSIGSSIHQGWIGALDGRLAEAAAAYGLPFSGGLPQLERDCFMMAIPWRATSAFADIPALNTHAEVPGYLDV